MYLFYTNNITHNKFIHLRYRRKDTCLFAFEPLQDKVIGRRAQTKFPAETPPLWHGLPGCWGGKMSFFSLFYIQTQTPRDVL